MVTTPAPTLPNLQPATAPRTAGTPNPTTAPPGSLGRLTTPALRLALSEAERDRDTVALSLRSGINSYPALTAVAELRTLRTKIDALGAELARRGEVTSERDHTG